VAEDWLYPEIGRRIRDARLEAGLTQAALGDAVGLARTSVTNIETGNQQLTLHALWRIGDALGVSPRELLPPWPEPSVREPHIPDDVPRATRAVLMKLAVQQRGGPR
jgi:transcriptional regulator with XRE-family HTH domain